MATGLSTAFAGQLLSVLRGVSAAGLTCYVKLHVGDPGAAGTANPSAVTSRNAVTWAAPTGGSMDLSALAAWAMTTGETISHVSVWDAASGGTFLFSGALTTPKAVLAGDTLQLTALTVSKSPLAS